MARKQVATSGGDTDKKSIKNKKRSVKNDPEEEPESEEWDEEEEETEEGDDDRDGYDDEEEDQSEEEEQDDLEDNPNPADYEATVNLPPSLYQGDPQEEDDDEDNLFEARPDITSKSNKADSKKLHRVKTSTKKIHLSYEDTDGVPSSVSLPDSESETEKESVQLIVPRKSKPKHPQKRKSQSMQFENNENRRQVARMSADAGKSHVKEKLSAPTKAKSNGHGTNKKAVRDSLLERVMDDRKVKSHNSSVSSVQSRNSGGSVSSRKSFEQQNVSRRLSSQMAGQIESPDDIPRQSTSIRNSRSEHKNSYRTSNRQRSSTDQRELNRRASLNPERYPSAFGSSWRAVGEYDTSIPPERRFSTQFNLQRGTPIQSLSTTKSPSTPTNKALLGLDTDRYDRRNVEIEPTPTTLLAGDVSPEVQEDNIGEDSRQANTAEEKESEDESSLSGSSKGDGSSGESDESDTEERDPTSESDVGDRSGGSKRKKKRHLTAAQELRRRLKKEEQKEKRELRYEFWKMEQQGIPVSQKYTMDSNIDEMRFEYHKLKSEGDLRDKIKFGWGVFSSITSLGELFNERLNPFGLSIEGFSQEIDMQKEDYEKIFRKIYKNMAGRFYVRPGMQLVMTFGSQLIMFLAPRLLKKFTSSKIRDKDGFGKSDRVKEVSEEGERIPESTVRQMEDIKQMTFDLKTQVSQEIVQMKQEQRDLIRSQNEFFTHLTNVLKSVSTGDNRGVAESMGHPTSSGHSTLPANPILSEQVPSRNYEPPIPSFTRDNSYSYQHPVGTNNKASVTPQKPVRTTTTPNGWTQTTWKPGAIVSTLPNPIKSALPITSATPNNTLGQEVTENDSDYELVEIECTDDETDQPNSSVPQHVSSGGDLSAQPQPPPAAQDVGTLLQLAGPLSRFFRNIKENNKPKPLDEYMYDENDQDKPDASEPSDKPKNNKHNVTKSTDKSNNNRNENSASVAGTKTSSSEQTKSTRRSTVRSKQTLNLDE